MPPRFYAPELRPGLTNVELPADEAAHLTRVLRLRVGAEVRVFDGRGYQCIARVSAAHKDVVRLEVLGPAGAAPEPRVRLTLAPALLKGDKLDDIIRDAVMLGVALIQPILTDRIDVPAAAAGQRSRQHRWQRIAISSVKQCGRAVVPEVRPPASLAACLGADTSQLRVMLVEPDAQAPAGSIQKLGQGSQIASALVLVGPEGGWTPQEIASAAGAGCQLVTLGRRTLRADAAPTIAVAVLQAVWGDL